MAARYSMKQNLLLFSGAAVCALAVNLVLFVVYAGKTTQDISHVIHVDSAMSILLHEMWADGLQTEQALRNVMFNPGDTKAMNNYDKADRDFIAANDKALALADDGARPVLSAIKEQWSAIGGVKEEIRQLAIAGQPKQAVETLNSRETPLWRDIKGKILTLNAAQQEQFAAAFANHQQAAALGRTIVIGVALCCIIALLAYGFSLNRAISRPLAAMIAYSRQIADGDFSASITGAFASEFENLKSHLLRMTEALKKNLGFSRSVMRGFRQPFLTMDMDSRVTFINRHALALLDITGSPEDFIDKPGGLFFYGDASKETTLGRLVASGQPDASTDETLTSRTGRQVQVRADRCRLVDLEGNVIGGIATYLDLTAIKESQALAVAKAQAIEQAAKETGDIATGLLDFIERLSQRISQVATGAAEQRERIEQAASVMEDLQHAVETVAKSAETASQEAVNTEEKAQKGAEVVDRSMEAIRQVAKAANDLGTNMTQLGQQSDSIGAVIEVIGDIADQTNLLALNAAIEAARAGEAGRGFAVVADEVRKLAEKTMNATKEVGDNIRGIQDAATRSVTRMREATATIDEATKLAGASGEALHEIVRMAQKTAASSREIVTVSQEQTKTAQEIAASAGEVQRIADQTDDGMRQAATDVEQLTRMAGSLDGLVKRLGS